MKTLKKIKATTANLAIAAAILTGLGLLSTPAFAATAPSTPGSSSACQDTTTDAALKKCVVQSPIIHDLQQIINFLSAGVGIVVIGVIILGGIQYSIAGDNAQAISAARQRIFNGLIALVAFIFTFAFLNWLIPGGAFG